MRCFIAAWPDQPTRVALGALADEIRVRVGHRRATRIDDLHLTLTFIGALTDDNASAVAAAVAELQFMPFELPLDTLGFFEEAGVVWAGSGAASEARTPLLELARRSRQVLDRMNVDYDRRPLAPHVTLMRGVREFAAETIAPPILWRIDSIALYRSAGGRSGSRYSRVTRPG